MTQNSQELASETTANTHIPSAFIMLMDIFIAPFKTLKVIQSDFPVLVPLICILTLNAILILSLFATIDIAWYIDHLVEVAAGDATNDELEKVRNALSAISASKLGSAGMAAELFAIVAFQCAMATYLTMVSGIIDDGYQFKQWLSLVVFASLPKLISVLTGIVYILTSENGQILPESIDPLSLNALFFNLDPTFGFGAILASTSITLFWSISLLAIGHSMWSEKKLIHSLMIVSAPFIVYYTVRIVMI